MSMFVPITKDVFRWGTIDGESGFMMYSHLVLNGDNAVLIDPVALPGLKEMIKILSVPVAVIMTNYAHLRGCPLLSRQLDIPLYIPQVGAIDEDVSLVNTFIDLYSMNDAIRDEESTVLPLGIRAIPIRGRHEMALNFKDFLIVGDSAYGMNGKLTFYPIGFRPDTNGIADKASSALKPIIKSTGAAGLLSGHMEDIVSGLQGMI